MCHQIYFRLKDVESDWKWCRGNQVLWRSFRLVSYKTCLMLNSDALKLIARENVLTHFPLFRNSKFQDVTCCYHHNSTKAYFFQVWNYVSSFIFFLFHKLFFSFFNNLKSFSIKFIKRILCERFFYFFRFLLIKKTY